MEARIKDLSKSRLIYVLIVSSFVAYTHFLGEEG